MDIELVRTEIKLGDKIVYLDVVDDVEALITDLADADAVPCWAVVWPSARTLARYIYNNLNLTGKTVLELGSGLGLPGTVCGLCGGQVMFSDYNQDAVDLSLHNAALNGVKAEGWLGDWRSFSLQQRFDCLICSDICYDPQLNPYLLAICHKNLKAGGEILISHQRRQPTYQFVEQLKSELKLQEIRIDSIEKDEESVYGQFFVSIHHLQPAHQPLL
jgi:predicted nicotinamide N-methyase